MLEHKFHNIKNVRNMLLISLHCIGDTLLTTPVAKVLKDTWPAARLTVVCGPTAAPLLDGHPLVDRVIVFDSRKSHKGARGMASLLLLLRDTKYDVTVDLRNSAIPYTLRTRHRITAHKTHLDNRTAKGRHAIDRHLDVLESHGFAITCREMQIHIPDAACARAEEIYAKIAPPDGAPLIGIYPGAGNLYKQYHPYKFTTVLKGLAELRPDARFCIIGGPNEKPVADIVIEGCPERTTSFCGALNIVQTAALIEKFTLLISNDSGPMHIAAALHIPTVAIFGPTDATRYGPRGAGHRIVWHREQCNPCKSPECDRETCINLIPEQEIIAAAAGILGTPYTAPEPTDSHVEQLKLFEE